MNRKIELSLLTVSFLFLIAGCTTPIINEAKFESDGYINYDQNAIINFKLYNPAETSFNGKIEIQAIAQSGFFNCFQENIQENLTVILPKKSLNGDIEIPSKRNANCKNNDFDVYFVLKDANSNEIITKNKLPLKIKG